MNKYKLNFLRWMTRGELDDEALKSSFNHRVEGDRFKFSFKANFNPKDWRWVQGTCKN